MTRRRPSETRKSRRGRIAPRQETYDAILTRLVEAREAVGLSQREVSALMERGNSFVSKCETGDRTIDLMEFIEFAELYKTSLAALLGEK